MWRKSGPGANQTISYVTTPSHSRRLSTTLNGRQACEHGRGGRGWLLTIESRECECGQPQMWPGSRGEVKERMERQPLNQSNPMAQELAW